MSASGGGGAGAGGGGGGGFGSAVLSAFKKLIGRWRQSQPDQPPDAIEPDEVKDAADRAGDGPPSAAVYDDGLHEDLNGNVRRSTATAASCRHADAAAVGPCRRCGWFPERRAEVDGATASTGSRRRVDGEPVCSCNDCYRKTRGSVDDVGEGGGSSSSTSSSASSLSSSVPVLRSGSRGAVPGRRTSPSQRPVDVRPSTTSPSRATGDTPSSNGVGNNHRRNPDSFGRPLLPVLAASSQQLPPSIPVSPDGEEGYASTQRRLATINQQSPVDRSHVFQAPPNRTVCHVIDDR